VTVKKSGLIKEGTKYYFYDKKGNKLKSKWKTIQKRRYYFKADGTAAVGGTKIGKYTYVFLDFIFTIIEVWVRKCY